MAKYKYVMDPAMFEGMEHVFEVPDEYSGGQRQHVMLQQKRIAAQEFKSVAYDFLKVEGILEEEDGDTQCSDSPENEG